MERVVLLTEAGTRRGVMDKAAAHHQDTPLHLAFSCYLFNPLGELLLTQRAHTKKTWPGIWTNSCCGHPAPDENLPDSVRRRLAQELGISADEVTLVLPRFRYRAAMPNGIVENEMCPVFRATTNAQPVIEPSEVTDARWVEWSVFAEEVSRGLREVSPWCAQQVSELIRLGPSPQLWPTGDNATLPPAARPASE